MSAAGRFILRPLFASSFVVGMFGVVGRDGKMRKGRNFPNHQGSQPRGTTPGQ
jgi:hypothetical protein